MTNFLVKTVTGNKFGGGTNANVYIVLQGDKGQTDKHFLKSITKSHEEQFQVGHTDTFEIRVDNDIGKLRKISVGHDEMMLGCEDPDWYLEKVVVECPSKKRSWSFPCNRWLAVEKDDGKVERELVPE